MNGLIGWNMHTVKIQSQFISINNCVITGHLNDCLIDWLIDWSIDWLIDWLTDWLTDWLIGLVADW